MEKKAKRKYYNPMSGAESSFNPSPSLKKSKCCGADTGKTVASSGAIQDWCLKCGKVCDVSSPKKKERRIKAWAVVVDEGEGWLPIALTFKQRTLQMDNWPKNIKSKVVDCTITYKL